ncbi:MAG: hypothetical protein CVT92_09755 [Bacteroidetes bacterium HGW-Bacteroidetes-1]|jgi:hypothetical protein|nr:MAG: hypothetical protein CVT92_09755 [Bacteroidetes bacterium HGW-Bacteroidetes-1]
MKNIQKYILLITVIVFSASSCSERYDIKLDESFIRLVVDGIVTTDTTHQLVRITTSTSYFSNLEPPAVLGATLYLDNGTEKILLKEDPKNAGYYYTPTEIYGIPGSSYELDINLKEKIGNSDRYVAYTQMPTTYFTMDSIVLEYQQAFDFYLIKLYAFDPPTTDFYKFDALINGIILTDTASRSLIVDDRFFNGNNTNGLGVMFLRSTEVNTGDTITLLMSAISSDYYDFFVELRTEAGQGNPLFSGPPANIRSNILEGGLGYFAANITKKASIIVPNNPKDN